jgi:hypothetical protein
VLLSAYTSHGDVPFEAVVSLADMSRFLCYTIAFSACMSLNLIQNGVLSTAVGTTPV